MTIDLQKYKTKLEEELKRIEGDLKTVGRINPDNPGDWEATPEKIDVMPADRNETADQFESYGENSAILNELEIRYNDFKTALQRIEDGSYGTCVVCEKEIEEERLNANLAAATCIAHKNIGGDRQ